MSGFERLTDLSIHASSMEPRVDGTPLRGLGWVEIAATMASLPSEGGDLLRATYLDDHHALARTVKRLTVRLSGSAALSPEMRAALAVTVVQAFFSLRTCGTCDGHGHLRGHLCPTCLGECVDHLRPDAIRAMLEVSEPVWDALLAVPFGELYRELLSWHEVARAMLERRVR
jgi:hypothetical protein